MTEAGWLQDPQDPTRLRYWDGTAWTDNVAAQTGPPAVAPAKSRTGLIVGIVVACVAALVLVPVVAVVAIQFLGTSAKQKFDSVGTAIGTDPPTAAPPTTITDPGPFTAVMRTVLTLDSRPCGAGAISDLDESACVTTSAESVPLKGLAGAVPNGDTWKVEVTFKPDTSTALDHLMAGCAPTPKGDGPLGRLAIVRVGRSETVITAPLVSISSFEGHAEFTGFTESKAKLLADVINGTK